jgi:hypothetical protein
MICEVQVVMMMRGVPPPLGGVECAGQWGWVKCSEDEGGWGYAAGQPYRKCECCKIEQ